MSTIVMSQGGGRPDPVVMSEIGFTSGPSTTPAGVLSSGAPPTPDGALVTSTPVVPTMASLTGSTVTPGTALLQDTLEMATITDMLNEEDFVSIPQRRLEQMQGLLLYNTTVESTDVVQIGVPQYDRETVQAFQEGNSDTEVETTEQTALGAQTAEPAQNETVLRSLTPEENGDNVVIQDDLEIVEDHFIQDAEGAEDAQGVAVVQPDPATSEISISPPSVGDVPSTTPPPTYAECMKDAIPLSFIDFWPQCISLNDENFLYSRFETFNRVVDAANLWLQEHPNIVIRNCETTEVKAASLDEYILNTAAKVSTFRSSFRPLLYIRGLRVWYSSKIINKLPFVFAVTPCVLRYKNIKPTLVNIGDHLEYEAFSTLVEKFNKMIQDGEVNGRLLNVESVCIKEPDSQEEGRIHLVTNPDESTWRDSYAKTARYILRVFYLPEQQVKEVLKFKDFLPEKSRSSKSHPKYREFTTCMDDCRLWLVHLSSRYRIINAQTMEVKLLLRDTMDTQATFCSDFEGAPRLRYLRIYYSEDAIDSTAEYGAPLLSHKTFIPAVLKKRRHETLAALMHRVETWLRATGATVVCAETLTVLEQRCTDRKDADFSLYRSEWMEANTEYDHETLLYVVRVYLDTVYPEPPPQIFLDGEEDPLDEDCAIL